MPSPDSYRPPTLLALPSYLAGSVARLGNSALVASLAEHGLRLPQFAVLTALHDFGDLAPHELATRLQTDRSHISTYVESLVQSGWVLRNQDAADRRRVTVTLTDDGRTKLARLMTAAIEGERSFLAALTAPEQRTLRTLLMKIITGAETTTEE